MKQINTEIFTHFASLICIVMNLLLSLIITLFCHEIHIAGLVGVLTI